VNSAIEVKKTEVDAKIQITDPNQLALFLEEEENYIRKLVDTIENPQGRMYWYAKKELMNSLSITSPRKEFSLSVGLKSPIWKPLQRPLAAPSSPTSKT